MTSRTTARFDSSKALSSWAGPTPKHKRRGKTKANVAIGRRVLTLVYCGLRDGEIRSLADQEAA